LNFALSRRILSAYHSFDTYGRRRDMLDQTLIMLANEVRGKTLRVLSDVTEEQARYTGVPALSNSILWHAGHALLVVEHLCVAPATGHAVMYPAEWFNIFSWESKPATVASWPVLAEVKSLLQDQLTRLTDVLKTLRQERMDQVIDAAKNRTLRFSILHGLHDEASHQGEMHMLKKLWRTRQA
jgi:hypothetical protein